MNAADSEVAATVSDARSTAEEAGQPVLPATSGSKSEVERRPLSLESNGYSVESPYKTPRLRFGAIIGSTGPGQR